MGKGDNKLEGEVVFGPFWQVAPDNEISIYHEGLNRFLAERGFFYLKADGAKRLCRMEGKLVEECDIADVTRCVYDFINSASVPEILAYTAKKKDLVNKFVRGIDNYINYPKLRLLPIKELKFHCDNKEESFFYFKNGVVRVTKDGISTGNYTGLNDYLWKRKIKPHSFTLLDSNAAAGEFETFCYRVCNKDEKRFESLKTIVGYLLHRYWHASNPVIPCFLDETSLGTDQAMGGTGKTLICQALQYARNLVDVDGKSFDPHGSFAFQRVNMDSEILFVDDLDRKTSFESWFSIASTGIDVNQKNKPAFRIPKEKMFKIVITSNFPIRSIPGRSTERRKVEFECSSYYGEVKPSDEFGHEFFTDWGDDQFNSMFNFLARCVQAYLDKGIIRYKSENYELRQLDSYINKDVMQFLNEKFFSRATDKFIKKDLYHEFLQNYPGQRQYHPSSNGFIMKVHMYLDHFKVQYTEIPANKKTVIEILDWGNLPDADGDAVATDNHKTLSDTPHNYSVVNTPATHSNVPGGQTMTLAEAMGGGKTNTDASGTTPEPPK
ncbi:MAG: hypothetical protein ACLQQ4_17970 [Bacteroidia bacterium]